MAGRTACPRPLRVGGGDIGFCCGDWNPRTRSDVNSMSVSCGESLLIASQNRCARASRRALEGGRVVGVVGDDRGDMIGVSGGVAKPTDECVAAAADTDTVAIT